jgi:hypothetical protein
MFNYSEMYESKIERLNSYLPLQEMNKNRKKRHFKSQLTGIDHLGSIDRGG